MLISVKAENLGKTNPLNLKTTLMKTTLIIFLFYIICPKLYGQNSGYIEYLNQEFQDFKPNPNFDSLEKKFPLKLNNIDACMAMLELPKKDLNVKEEHQIRERLKELSEKLFLQGTPIYLIENGKNSTLQADELNAKKSEKSIVIYVSLGNSCISTERQENGVNIFNTKTLELRK